MGDLLVCRVCLATNVKLYDMFENGLVFPYENLTGLKISKLSQFSHRTCSVCSTLLKKWISFKSLCEESQEVMLLAQQQNQVITEEYIQSLDLKTHILHNLTIVNDAVKFSYAECNGQIKEEISDFTESELIWMNYPCEEDTLSNQSGVKTQLIEEEVVAEEKDSVTDSSNDECPSDNEVPELYEEVDLLILTKDQQEAEMQARKSSLNYLNSFYKCQKCFKGFMTDDTYKNHMMRHDSEDNSKEDCFCNICDTQFLSLEAFKNHAGDENFCIDIRSCVHCGENFKSEISLKEHLKTHSKEEPTKCEECDKLFINKKAYAKHYQRVHLQVTVKRKSGANRKVVVMCEICGKKFFTKTALLAHQRIHTGEKPFECTYCPKKFSVHQRLQIHMRVHTGETPYPCSCCPKAFKNKAALNRHVRVHTGEKPYGCSHCGKYFSQSNSMKVHIQTVHLKMPAPYKSKARQAEKATD